jgi:hypothetical protein
VTTEVTVGTIGVSRHSKVILGLALADDDGGGTVSRGVLVLKSLLDYRGSPIFSMCPESRYAAWIRVSVNREELRAEGVHTPIMNGINISEGRVSAADTAAVGMPYRSNKGNNHTWPDLGPCKQHVRLSD